ncbi:MAG TPA: type II toxin-antitoxin system VapC family toxin [Thermoanaerobaculia bacterium]|nr:type II toxin-antitoxin system VapC family toxin [Thermoanaerobaculia bacterium]
MILPDINLLVYAYNSDAPNHRQAKAWWEACLTGSGSVGLPWATLLGFLRLMTNRSVLVDPLSAEEAIGHIRSWLERPQAQILHPGSRHLEVLASLMRSYQASAKLTTDAHLAALAIEHQAELHSNDGDFARFPGLRWTNPLR